MAHSRVRLPDSPGRDLRYKPGVRRSSMEQQDLSAVWALSWPLVPSLPPRCQGQRPSGKPILWETPYWEFPGQVLTGVKASALGSTFHGLGHNSAAVTASCPVSTLLGRRHHLGVFPINPTGGCVPVAQERCVVVTLNLAFGIIIHNQGYVEAMAEWPEYGLYHLGRHCLAILPNL